MNVRLLLTLVLALVFAGCSNPLGRDEPTSTPAVSGSVVNPPAGDGPAVGQPQSSLPPQPGPVPTEAPPAPVVGGHVTELIPLYPQSFNPLFSETESQWRVESLLFDGLLRIDPQTQAPVPALASEMDVSADGLTYTFNLRPNLKWHDGSPVTADDVVWTFEVLRDPELDAPLQPYAAVLEDITAVDSDTIRFELSERYSPFPARLATVPIIPREPFQGLTGNRLRSRLLDWKSPIGTGPFRWGSARPGQSIELVANRHYFGGAPLLDRYNLRVMRDPAEIQQALYSGEADIAWVSPAQMESIGEQDFLTQEVIGTPTTTFVFFNVDPESAGALADVRVRRALAHAIDLDRVSAATQGVVQPAWSFQPPTSPAHRVAEAPHYPYDPARARLLLQAAGWRDTDGDGIREKGGEELRLTLYVNEVPDGFPETLGTSYEPAVRRLAADWKAVGVRTRVREEGWEQLAPRLFEEHDFDAAVLSMSADADPDHSYLWSTDAYADGYNIGRYTDARVDGLLEEGIEEQDLDERLEVYRDLQEALADDLPAVPLGTAQAVLIRSNRLMGFDPSYWSALQHTDVQQWYVQDGR